MFLLKTKALRWGIALPESPRHLVAAKQTRIFFLNIFSES